MSTLSMEGINWVHFIEVKGTQIIREYRMHKGDKMPATDGKYRMGMTGKGMRAWDKDGRPGGLDGYKDNYRGSSIKISLQANEVLLEIQDEISIR